VKDGKSQSGSQSRGWPEAQTPGWPGRRRVPCISLRCTNWVAAYWAGHQERLPPTSGRARVRSTGRY
jgi:hypothetical protein